MNDLGRRAAILNDGSRKEDYLGRLDRQKEETMAYDEGLAQRLREAFVEQPGVVEKKMFGGLAFMVQGHMCCGVLADELMVRVGPDHYEVALTRPHAREMDFTGRPMRGMVMVAGDGFETERDLAAWVERGLKFVLSLPPK